MVRNLSQQDSPFVAENFSTTLSNNVILSIVFCISLIFPVYVWFGLPERMNNISQIFLAVIFIGLFKLSLHLACIVYKNIRKKDIKDHNVKENTRDKDRGKIIAKTFLLVGALNFILYISMIPNSKELLFGHYLQLVVLILFGIIGYKDLKKRPKKS
jgi:predicted histidine transporter YuiF (NhaC family)